MEHIKAHQNLNKYNSMEHVKAHKHFNVWLITGCILIYIMLVIGCITRLTHSGLSITDWSFMGSIPPFTDAAWTNLFLKYQASPEFININFSMTLDEFKHIYFWEYLHRFVGRLMMYIFLIGFLYLWFTKKIRKLQLPGIVGLFALGIMQALIGWWMVYSGLQKNPYVSHYRLAIHLLSAFTLFGFTFYILLKSNQQQFDTMPNQGNKLRKLIWVLFCILILQIIFGAFTAGFVIPEFGGHIRPGQILNTWPKMGEHWINSQVFDKQNIFISLFENAPGIQFVHRYLAIILALGVSYLWVQSNKLTLTKHQTLGITLLIFGVTIQFILGVLTLCYHVPLLLGVLHQTGGLFLFATGIFCFFIHNKN